METVKFETLTKIAIDVGFQGVEIIKTDEIVLSAEFRDACEKNTCGLYGKCWMCPPDAGDIDMLMSCINNYSYGLLVQSIDSLEDSFDIEGMLESRKLHAKKMRVLKKKLKCELPENVLFLSVGGCGYCKECSKLSDTPCRFPEEALSSLEAYGINVSATVGKTSLRYINGQNTVTYFGIVLF